jgi:cytidine deaminase
MPEDEPDSAQPPAVVQSIEGRPELVFGFVAPLGTNLPLVVDATANSLRGVGYRVHLIKLTDLLRELIHEGTFNPGIDTPDTPEALRIRKLQAAGGRLRQAVGHDAMAVLAIAKIRELRDDPEQPAEGTAYLLSQMKHPAEVELLREIFGDRFVLVGAGSDRATRQLVLAKRLAGSDVKFDYHAEEPAALELINIDEYEGDKAGQQVREVFPMADLFLDPAFERSTVDGVQRFVELLFGHPFHTPHVDELGMRLAHTMALRSASLGRQVGAAIMRTDGTIVAAGANDVPRAGGGVYWPQHEPDWRDHMTGKDSSNDLQQRMVGELIDELKKADWFKQDIAEEGVQTLVQRALETGMLRGLRVMSLLEFGRTLHAEMNAILDAARYGSSIQGTVLYGTTYPCHECTRHIIGGGIARVVFIEPYPKSLADTLHDDAIRTSGACEPAGVLFQPFVGVAPRRFDHLFEMHRDRKHPLSGVPVSWDPLKCEPAVANRWGPIVARTSESRHLSRLNDALNALRSASSDEK